jgi:hypothetical protein
MGLSFTIASGPRQGSHSLFQVPRYSQSHFTFSDSRLTQPGRSGPHIYIPEEQGGLVISPDTGFPTIRVAKVKVLDPASTREIVTFCLHPEYYKFWLPKSGELKENNTLILIFDIAYIL